MAAVVARAFERDGWRVVVARHGEEGLASAAGGGFSVVVADYQMPGMSGVELATRLASLESTKDVPVMLLTARAHLVNRDELSRTNIRRVMGKPFSARELVQAAHEVVGVGAASGDAGVKGDAA